MDSITMAKIYFLDFVSFKSNNSLHINDPILNVVDKMPHVTWRHQAFKSGSETEIR